VRRLIDPCHYQSRDAFESPSPASESARRMALFSFQVYRSLGGRSIAGPHRFCPEAVDSHFSDTGHLRLKFCSRALNSAATKISLSTSVKWTTGQSCVSAVS
jgi:hypothetical protein